MQTAIKSDTLNPAWEEIHLFKIFDLDVESLTMEVWDKDDLNEDDKIGTVTVALSPLKDGKFRTFLKQPIDFTGLQHAKKKKYVDNPATLNFELLYAPFGVSAEDLAVPANWDIPPSGVLKVLIKKSFKLPAKKLKKLSKGPFVQGKVGHSMQSTKPSRKLDEGSVEFNQELSFVGRDHGASTRPRGLVRGKIWSRVHLSSTHRAPHSSPVLCRRRHYTASTPRCGS